MSQIQTPDPVTGQRTGTIFIVDDEMMVTSSLQTMLGLETSHRIHTFNNPLDALQQVKALRPDVVISDFSMPGMDGITFLRSVKQTLPEATLILLTGYADKESAIEAINTVGIYRYIEKPWDNEDLKISINNGLERSYLVADLRRSVHDLTVARAELERHNHQLEALVEERTQDLRATYRKLQSIVDNTADGILTLDADLALTSVNPAAERWFRTVVGMDEINLLNVPLERLLKVPTVSGGVPSVPPGGLAGLFDARRPIQVGELLIGELPVEASIAPLNGTSLLSSGTPGLATIADEDVSTSDVTSTNNNTSKDAQTGLTIGTHSFIEPDGGFVVVLRDIAARKEIERLRDDFVSTLTHDLRTPLLAAIQTLGFFIDGSLGDIPDRQRELIGMLIQSLREMLGLVNVLLEVYKYESGRQKLIFDAVDLSDLVRHVCQELDSLAKNREQTLEIVPDKKASFKVRGDKQELKRVLVNLIGNAINFTPKGGRIEVTLTPTGKSLQVCVSDNGRGIPAKDIPLLFQRFSQGTSKQRSSGSGLGLYLSRQIIEAHHGQIRVESQDGQGSQFYVTLPVLK